MSDFNGPTTEMKRIIENRCEIRRLEVENSYLQKCMNSLHAEIERKDEALKDLIIAMRRTIVHGRSIDELKSAIYDNEQALSTEEVSDG